MRVFILGAPDPEMHAIEALLKERGEAYVYASSGTRRVTVGNAYAATGVLPEMPENASEFIFVECVVMGLRYSDLIDHHRPGDPGYDMGPEQYLEGSSFGQLLTMLGLEPTEEQRIICAADHCLSYAYQGRCPGVDPKALAAWRAKVRAARKKVSIKAFENQVQKAHQLMLAADRIEVGGEAIAWVGEMVHEFGEAGARYGIPFMATQSTRDGKVVTLFGAQPETIQLWMRECGLERVFGAPVRGYAGGYAG